MMIATTTPRKIRPRNRASSGEDGNGSANDVHQPVGLTSSSGRNDDRSIAAVGMVQMTTSAHSTPVGMAPMMRWMREPAGSPRSGAMAVMPLLGVGDGR